MDNDLVTVANVDSNPLPNIIIKEVGHMAYYNPFAIAKLNIKKEKISSCLHERCPECNGTLVKSNGDDCLHPFSCDCHECKPYCHYGEHS